METYSLVTNSGYRRERLNGRRYLVVSATIIVPGVLNGSRGALLYPKEEVAANPGMWNDIPVTLGHPYHLGQNVSAKYPGILDRSGLGVIRNDRYANGKRKVEVWLDEKRTKRLAPDIRNAVMSGQPVEVSTGLYTENDDAPPGASHNGRAYDYIARNYHPDHLAVLRGQVGACSVQDGCGLGVNAAAKPSPKPPTKPTCPPGGT